MKRKKDFLKAKEDADQIIECDVDIDRPYLEVKAEVEISTGQRNLLARFIAGGLMQIGWYSCIIHREQGDAGLKTLFVLS